VGATPLSAYLVLAVVALGMVAVLLAAVQVGYRQGLRTRPDEHLLSHATAWEGALLGLLALLIGFTFAMAVARFDGRRELILEEANAIESVSLRARYLDPPARDQVQALLVPYVEARIEGYQAGIDRRRTESAYHESKVLQERLWEVVVSVARAHPNSEVVAAFVEAADDLVKAESRRRAALDNHVPFPVFAVLLMVA